MKNSVLCGVVLLTFVVAVFGACSRDEDCFLNGVCTNGNCVCDYSWSGATCNVINFHPAPPTTGYGLVPNVTAWGGIPVLVGNTYHLLNTEIVDGCGLCKWGSNSRVIHATSDTLLGPYKYQNQALGIWSHNPHVIADHSSGTPTYLLFHIGNADGGTPVNCPHQGVESGFGLPKSKAPMASGVLHTATDPSGTWTPQNPSGLGGCNNPAPYVFTNGSIILVCAQDGTNVYTANNWKGPWRGASLQYSGNAGTGIWEDPFIWRDKRGNFKMIAHVYPQPGQMQHYWDRVSGFAYSRDGIHWVRQPWQPYTNVIQHTTGSISYTTRERPKIFFDKDGVTPLALFTGVARGTNCWDCKLQCGVDWTYNLAQGIAP